MPSSTRSVRLVRHPHTPCDAVVRIDAAVRRAGDGALELVYQVEGDLGAVKVPAPRQAVRESGLWHHTCLEAFIAGPGASYREFNLAPSGAWAAYAFSAYREGMAPLPDAVAPKLAVIGGECKLELRAMLAVDGAARLALAAVIEESSGRLSYWALAHPPGKPDFHHPLGFALEI
jgi:hypothetical protein